MTLAEFLLARVAEDEIDARKAMPGPWELDGGSIYSPAAKGEEVIDWAYDGNWEHIARWDPARVLAECEAKRRVVQAPEPTTPGGYVDGWWEAHEYALRQLALPYAHYPDYQQEWKP